MFWQAFVPGTSVALTLGLSEAEERITELWVLLEDDGSKTPCLQVVQQHEARLLSHISLSHSKKRQKYWSISTKRIKHTFFYAILWQSPQGQSILETEHKDSHCLCSLSLTLQRLFQYKNAFNPPKEENYAHTSPLLHKAQTCHNLSNIFGFILMEIHAITQLHGVKIVQKLSPRAGERAQLE